MREVVATVTIGDRSWHLARKPMVLANDDGDRIEILAHWAEAGIRLELALFQLADPPEVVIDGAHLPGVDVALGRWSWTQATGEVALVSADESWDARVVLLLGVVTDASMRPGEVAALTISASVQPRPATVAEYAASKARFSNAPATSLGQTLPIPLGHPGDCQEWDGTAITVAASRCVYVDGTNGLIAVADGVVEAGSITLIEPESGSTRTETISFASVSDGRRYARVSVFGDGAPWTTNTLTFYAAFDQGSGGALSEASPAAPIKGVGDLALFLLRRSGVRWDRGRWRVAAELLNTYAVGGSIEQPVDPWQYLIDAVLPLAPVSLAVGPLGVYPIVHRFDVPAARTLIELNHYAPTATAIPGYVLPECLEDVVESSWLPSHRVRYAWDGALQDYRREVLVTGDARRRGEADTITTVTSLRAGSRHLAAQVGLDLPEPIPEQVLETDLLSSNAAAQLVALWRSALMSEPRRKLVYAADPGLVDLGIALLGMEVLLTDQVRGLSGVVARIEAIEYVPRGPSPLLLTLYPIGLYDTAE